MTTEADLIVDRFISSWSRGDVEDMVQCCADDVRYQNMPMEPGVGTAALREVQEMFFSVAQDFRIEVHQQVSYENLVMQERTDYYSIGGSAITLPICGVFEIESGRIAAWREYFDMATCTPA
ncbi:MAG: limonene-1,2-epoxide hydrolase family protein [Acidimicrobiia bacterium]